MISIMRRVAGRRLLRWRNPGLEVGRDYIVHRCEFERGVAVGDGSYLVHANIGAHSYLGPRSIVAHATIGRYCAIAADVAIGTGSHPLERNVSIHPMFYLHRPPKWGLVEADSFQEFRHTIVGSDVWIGTKAVLRDGIEVGHGAVLGAGAIATRDLEPYGVYVGAPARLVRFRFSNEEIAKLLAARWWDRDEQWIRRNARYFDDVGRFLADAES